MSYDYSVIGYSSDGFGVKSMVGREVIAVDGLAGSGKSTLSRLLAERLGFAHLNSGLLYRAVAWLCMGRGVLLSDSSRILSLIAEHDLRLVSVAIGGGRLLIDGRDLTDEVRTPAISDATSQIALLAEVRAALIPHQRTAFPNQGIVAEGRDMGTVIFPDAMIKFFIEASVDVRVTRRLAEFRATQKYNEMSQPERERLVHDMGIEITERDLRDSTRAVAPAKASPDAIIIDNSSDGLQRALEDMVDRVRGVGRTKSH